jgi:hypothetical protein
MTPATAESSQSAPTSNTAKIALGDASARAVAALVAKHGEAQRAAIRSGVERVAARWSAADGDAAAFESFCTRYFVADPAERTRLLNRVEGALEQITGHLYEMRRTLRRHHDLRGDEFDGVDDILAQFDPSPDLSEQLYRQKLAHLALLNFARPKLDDMLHDGPSWSVDQWVAARVAHQFGPRIPAELSDRARKNSFEAGKFVADFHVPVGGMVDANGKRWFEADRKLIAHWLVREEIKAGYGDADGVHKQRCRG